jgi:hypothetical protein
LLVNTFCAGSSILAGAGIIFIAKKASGHENLQPGVKRARKMAKTAINSS